MKKLFLFVACVALIGCKKETVTTTETNPETPPAAAADAAVPQAEITDAKYADIGKQLLAALSKGDMDAYISNYADNAKYYWSGGDSLVGKPAIDKFWRDRRLNTIETITFEKDIWLPVKVNRSQQTEKTGVWLLGWYKVTAKYKGGKTMTQWIHMDYHFDANGKIDEVNQYIDRSLVMDAMPPKK